MKLFYVYGTDDRDLFVSADTPQAAFRLWCAYYADWDKPKYVCAYELPTANIVACAHDMRDFPKTEFNVS